MCADPRQSPSQRPLSSTQEEAPFLPHISDSQRWAQNVKPKRKRQDSYGTMTNAQEKKVDMDLERNEDQKNVEKDLEKNGESKKPVILSKNQSQVPDGGWGWLVVVGVSLSNMSTQALVSVFGFLFSQRLAELNIATSGAAVILSVQSTVMNLSGLYTGALIRKVGYQKVAISGALLMMTGLMLTTLANSLATYIITYGICTGLGLGFLYPSTFVAVNSYFSAKRGIAVGWSVTGTGIGQMLLPLLVSYLLEEYSFRGTILILAALSGHSLVAALLYQPVEWHMKGKRKRLKTVTFSENGKTEANNEGVRNGTLKGVADNAAEGVKGLTIRRLSEPRNRSSASLHSIELDDKEQHQKSDNDTKVNVEKKIEAEKKDENSEKSSVWRKIIEKLDFDLLKSGSFLIVVIGCGVIYTANTSFQMLYPLFLENMQYSRSEIASAMMTFSAFDIIGRPILPYIVRVFQVRAKTIFFVSALLSAIFRSALATQSNMIPILILSAICGLFRSAIIINMNLSVAEQTTRTKLPAALGLQMVAKGLGSLTLGPLIGVIRDETGSFALCIHILSFFFMGVPFIAYLTERLCCNNSS